MVLPEIKDALFYHVAGSIKFSSVIPVVASAPKPQRNIIALLLSLGIFIAAQVFFVLLLLTSFQDYRARTYADLIEVNTAFTADKLSVVSALGRTIANYPKASQELYNLKMVSHSSDAFIVDQDGELILGPSTRGITHVDLSAIQQGNDLELDGVNYKAHSFHDRNGKPQGYVIAATTYDDSYATALKRQEANQQDFYLYLAISFLLSLGVFILCQHAQERRAAAAAAAAATAAAATAPAPASAEAESADETSADAGALSSHLRRVLNKCKSFGRFMLPFFIGQMLTCAAMFPHMSELTARYIENLEQTIGASVSRSFDELKQHDIALQDVTGYDVYFAQLKHNVDVIGGINISTPEQTLIAGDNMASSSGLMLPLCSSARVLGYLQVSVSEAVILDLLMDLTLKLMTILIVATVLAFELNSLLRLEQNRLRSPHKRVPFEAALIRPLSFLYVLALYLPITIVPVFMGKFAADFPNLDPTLLRSLSVITEMGFIALSSFYILLSRPYPTRWKKLGIGSVSLLTLAAFTAAIAPNGYVFLLSRAIYGLGYGAMLASCQLYVMSCVDPSERGVGLANLTSGLFSGVLCSASLGGIIADNLGQTTCFIASCALFALNLTLFLFLCAHRYIATPEAAAASSGAAPAAEGAASAAAEGSAATAPQKKLSLGAIFKLLRDPQVLSLLCCQALPYSIIGIGFFNFLLPITAANNHYGATTVGQLNFLYALIIIVCSPIMGSLLDKTKEKGYWLLSLSLVASALVPLLFSLEGINFIAIAIGAMLCLGLSASINESGQPAVLTRFPSAQDVGSDTAVMLLDSALRIGQTIGPLLLALIVASVGFGAFVYVSLGVIALAICFMLLQSLALIRQRRTKCAQLAS